jgi:signal transduction histidine kinase/HAMP domain-containing protein
VLLGGAVGFLIASLIAARLGRIAHAAAAIESGDLTTPLRTGFADEVGRLGAAFERMRRRLQASFGELASERDRVRQLVERLREGVVSVHADLTVDLANAEARRLLGDPRLRAGETLPDPWPAFALDAFVAGLFAPGAEATETLVETGGDRTIAIAGLPPHGGSASETAILVLSDVSERERRERAEREFVANAAHELRTPLMTIVGAVEALQARAGGDPHQERFVGHIAREAGRLTRLTRALLVLARAQTRQESPRSDPVDARELLEQVRAGTRPSDGVAVEVDCPPDLVLHTDRDLVEQALANLAANAARHTTSGRIVLAARRADGDRIELEVKDTGEGVAPSEQERVFERFYRANERDADGFGLGLSIVRQAVAALGGTIDFRSSPGAGTRVRIGLPVDGKEQA